MFFVQPTAAATAAWVQDDRFGEDEEGAGGKRPEERPLLELQEATSLPRPAQVIGAVHVGNGVSPPRQVARCTLGMAGTRAGEAVRCAPGVPPPHTPPLSR